MEKSRAEISHAEGGNEPLHTDESAATGGKISGVFPKGGFTRDEKRAGMLFICCFLFQEVDSDVFRALLVASLGVYAVSRLREFPRGA